MISINFPFSVTEFRVRRKLHKLKEARICAMLEVTKASRFGLSLNVSRPYLWLKDLKFDFEFEIFKMSQFSKW